MGMTIVEKVLAHHAVEPRESVEPGEIVKVHVDSAYMLWGPDYEFRKVWNPDRILICPDHNVPCSSIEHAEDYARARKWAKQWGIQHWIENGRGGIGHRVVGQKGFFRPGDICLCHDSHTTLGGAFNCLAIGVGRPELAHIIAKGETWFKVAPTVKVEIHGKLPEKVVARDIVLHLAGTFPSFIERNIEYGGPVVDALSLESRQCMAVASTELNCDFPVFAADHKTIEYVTARTPFGPFEPVQADEDATYAETIEIDVTGLDPYVATPHVIQNARSVTEVARKKIKIDQALVGACTNGGLEDLAIVAEILEGETLHPDVRMIVYPATQEIWKEALRLGYIQTLLDANVLVPMAACGPCGGRMGGLLASGEVCITATPRNFKGRMGSPDAFVYAASPVTVAASAIAGYIVDPREVE